MQTALDLYIDKINEFLEDACIHYQLDFDNEIYKEAKQLEKKQIEDAWEDGKGAFSTRQAEQYYNEQYKK